MKVKELIKKLNNLSSADKDREAVFYNMEYSQYESIDNIMLNVMAKEYENAGIHKDRNPYSGQKSIQVVVLEG